MIWCIILVTVKGGVIMSGETKFRVMEKEEKRVEKVSRLALYESIFCQVYKAYDPDDLRKVQNLYTNWSGNGVPVAHLADIIITKNPEFVSKSANAKAIAEQIDKYVNEYIESAFGLKTLNSDETKKITSIFPKIKSETIRSWITTRTEKQDNKPKTKKPGDDSRIALYMISFAYNLPYDENWNTDPEIDKNGEPVVPEPQNLSHQYLFSHIFRMKPLIKTPLEFCLTYCKCKGLTIKEAYNLFSKYLKEISESNKTVGGTRTLFKNVMDYDKDDFIRALCSYDMAINPESLIIEIKKFLMEMNLSL